MIESLRSQVDASDVLEVAYQFARSGPVPLEEKDTWEVTFETEVSPLNCKRRKDECPEDMTRAWSISNAGLR
jgi:hypothetical protein